VIKPGQRVVCILTGHVLKDPDVTVGYHTGMDMKAGKVDLGASKPTGKYANPPVKVRDDLREILSAMGVETKGMELSGV
jgi:threonine synthase